MTLDNKRVSIGIRNRDAPTSPHKKTIKIMTTLAQTQQTQQSTQPADKAAAKFDVALSLPPAETSLDSEYFREYLKEVIKTGNTPF